MNLSIRPWAALAVALCVATSFAAAEEWGTLRGQFVVDGDVPAPAKLSVTKDANVCSLHPPINEEVIVGPDGGLANVVIYLTADDTPPIHSDYAATADASIELDNKNCAFSPHVALYRTGQKLLLKNSDSVGHNSNITCISNTSQNVLIPAGGEVDVSFSAGERLPMTVACNIHPWMKAYILIQDHPYMACTDKDGKFEIKNLPVGEHEFVFWHEKLRYLRGFKIGGGETSRKGRLDISVKPGDDPANDLGQVKVTAAQLTAAD